MSEPEEQPRNIVPQALEAEESVLGAMLLSPSAVDTVAETLTASDFYRQSHGVIFQTMLAMHRDGEPIDSVTVVGALELSKKLDSVGGRVRINELAALVPATANVAHYARIVRDVAVTRDVIRGGGKIAAAGWNNEGTPEQLVDAAESIVFEIAHKRQRQDFVHVSEPLRDVYDRMVELADTGTEVIGVSSGFRLLDELTSGFQPGNLIVLAARPSMGKSGLALCIAAHVALYDHLPVAFFTLEMSRQEVVQRLISSEGHVESQHVRNGKMQAHEWDRVQSIASKIEAAPLYIDDSSLITIAEIRSKARRLKLRHPSLALVVVDYLQLMTSGSSAENRVQEISQISRSLKILAGEINTPVIALSQLSRQVEQRHDKRPILSDLRESGAIEQDADLVAFVYRDEYYNPENADLDGTAGIAEVILAKQRNGPTGTIKLSFVKRYAKFSTLALPGDMGAVS